MGAADLRYATGLRPLVSLVPAHFCPGPPKNTILATPLFDSIIIYGYVYSFWYKMMAL